MMSDTAQKLSDRALLFDRSARLRMQFTGPKAVESLTGLVTNDVLALRGSDGQYACALTPKGRVIADVRILATSNADGLVDALLVDTNAAAGVGFAAMIRKYVNPRLAKYIDISASTACLTLSGAGALDLLTRLGAAVSAVDDVRIGGVFTHRTVEVHGASFRLVRIPDVGSVDAFDLNIARSDVEALTAHLHAAGAASGDDADWHRMRVTAGRPEWGVDMDESTLAQEANMDALHAISYRKGCYTGQETVARVHFRGHVNRTLRRVSYADGATPPLGTALLAADSAAVGDARSTAFRDDGALVGIAMIRREVGDGAVLTWLGGDGVVHPLTVNGAPDSD